MASKRRDLDFYPTPFGVVDTLVGYLCCRGINFHGRTIFDPTAGDGAILDAVRYHGVTRTLGYEIDRERCGLAREKGHVMTCADSLADWRDWPAADGIIQNAPFAGIVDFVERSFMWAERHKVFAANLVRLSFLSSKGRLVFHQTWPAHVLIISGRPSFTGDGKTDSVDYCWIVSGPKFANREVDFAPLVTPAESAAMRKEAA